MKKIRNIAIFVVLAVLTFFFPDQSDYYLTDDLFSITFIQGIIIVLSLFVVITTTYMWAFWREEAWYESLTSALGATFFLSFMGFIFILPVFKQGTLLLNRMHSSESVIQKHEISRRYGFSTVDFTSKENDTIYVRFRDKFPQLYDENREGKDSAIIQFEKGLFGYYYINREKTKLISKEN